MITLVDTCVLLDVFLPDPIWGNFSSNALKKVLLQGDVIINEIIYAELVPQFPSRKLLDETITMLGLRLQSLDSDTAFMAGRAWKEYKQAGGTRERIMSDFLIGAHAQTQAAQLLTRDRGFYRKHFKTLKVIYD